jgi:hypothetical protein
MPSTLNFKLAIAHLDNDRPCLDTPTLALQIFLIGLFHEASHE